MHSSLDSLVPGRSGFNFKSAIFNLVLLIGIFRSSYDNALRWISWDLSDDKSTLVQVMAWCRQATSHYLSQCWPRSVSPYGVTRAQWVNLVNVRQNTCNRLSIGIDVFLRVEHLIKLSTLSVLHICHCWTLDILDCVIIIITRPNFQPQTCLLFRIGVEAFRISRPAPDLPHFHKMFCFQLKSDQHLIRKLYGLEWNCMVSNLESFGLGRVWGRQVWG